MQPGSRLLAGAGLIGCLVAAIGSTGPAMWLCLVLAAAFGGWLAWPGRQSVRPLPVERYEAGQAVWADAEAALARIARRAEGGDALGVACGDLVRAAGPAIEVARLGASHAMTGQRLRRLVCLSADALAAAGRHESAEDIALRLQQVAAELEGATGGGGTSASSAPVRVLDRHIGSDGSDVETIMGDEARCGPGMAAGRRGEIAAFVGDATDAFDLEAVRSRQRDLIAEIKHEFDWQTPEQFASREAAAVAGFADTIISGARSADLGSVHEHLTELRLVTRRLGGRLEPDGFLGRLLFNGRKALERFAADWDSVQDQVDRIVAMLERHRRASDVSIENLRGLRAESIQQFRRMAAAIIAGRELLEAERARIATLRARIGEQADTPEAAEIRQLEQRADLFDRRLTNLEKSRAIAAGMIPTIQQALHSEVVVSEELDMALAQAVPLMKQQLALVVEQVRQRERLESLQATRRTTERMMGEIAERLRENQDLLDEQSEHGLASSAEVARFVERVGTTIAEIDGRQAQAQQARREARASLQAAVEELATRLAVEPRGPALNALSTVGGASAATDRTAPAS